MTEKTSISTEEVAQTVVEPLIVVPGISSEILESFRNESAVGYALFKAVIEAGDVSNNPDRMEQLKVFLYLPKKFQESLASHLILAQERDRMFHPQKSVTNAVRNNFTQAKRFRVLKGEFFEELVRTENKMYELQLVRATEEERKKRSVQLTEDDVEAREKLKQQSIEDKEKFAKKLKLTRQLLKVWQYPDLFGLPNRWNNPDSAFFEIEDDGSIVIKAVGEAKSGMLNSRAYGQLIYEGIQKQLHEVTDTLKSKDPNWFKKYDLELLGENIDMLHVANDFKIRLIIPRNKKVAGTVPTRKEAEALIKSDWRNRDFVFGSTTENPVKVTSFIDLLADSGRITIQKSQFSKKELDAMSELLYGYIDE